MALAWSSIEQEPLRDWRVAASCRRTDPDLFFPVGTTGLALVQIEAAKT
ncbi:MAG: transcription factor WhiB, partial [Acidimicrobiia bacterium]|nr:transcription factor WhiB [Acidimicrobiia bacterium]